jgi:hypothetical protein
MSLSLFLQWHGELKLEEIERGDNWWHISLVTSPIEANYFLVHPIGEIVDSGKLSTFALSQEEKDFLMAHPPSTLALPLYEVPIDGYNSANRLLGLSLY